VASFVVIPQHLLGAAGKDHANRTMVGVSAVVTKGQLLSTCQYCWIKREQLDVTCFIISLFNAQHVSDVNTTILRSLRLMC